ncbi:hypothetical protein BDY24DRAFT_378039 [Mrakia frigida]|uniref:uncharacterized protein n=1 Tax=Mrakia frigida TaxID=29902 RepID=UPI003FCC15CE
MLRGGSVDERGRGEGSSSVEARRSTEEVREGWGASAGERKSRKRLSEVRPLGDEDEETSQTTVLEVAGHEVVEV